MRLQLFRKAFDSEGGGFRPSYTATALPVEESLEEIGIKTNTSP